jgi:chromatin segregation and condensation protein Rec8/ScpA/Scc1 (kleisin family)
VTFLALLELLNTQKVKINQGDGANNFWVSIQEEIVSE